MTDLEILTNCINELARVNIPMGMIEQVGIPVYNVRQELINLANSIIEKENKVGKDEPKSPVIEEVPPIPGNNQNGSEAE